MYTVVTAAARRSYAPKQVRTFGAKGAPHDDTIAVGTAVDAIVQANKDWKFPPEQCVEHPVGPSVLYFPAGRYILSDTIQLYPSDNSTCKLHDSSLMIVVMGESSDSSIVRLADHAAGFNNPNDPKPLFLTHPGTAHNNGQWLSYIDLHVEIGQGNSGAVALRHVANNIGAVEHVSLSAPYGGAAGIDFPLFLGGLTLFKHIHITGFSIGVNVSQPQDILAIEHLYVENATVGLQLFDKGCAVRGMVTAEVAAPIIAHGSTASLVVVDSSFVRTTSHNRLGEWDKQSFAAVTSYGAQLFARNLTATGFQAGLRDYSSNSSDASWTDRASPVVEYSHSRPFFLPNGTSVPSQATYIEAKETPTVPREDVRAWAVFQLKGQDKTITSRLQQVIDADDGPATLLLRGDPDCKSANLSAKSAYWATACFYGQEDAIVLRNNLARLHGGWTSLSAVIGPGSASFPAFESIRVENFEHKKPVFIEYFTNLWALSYNSSNDLVLRYVNGRGMKHFNGSVVSNQQRADLGVIYFESVMLGYEVSGAGQHGGPGLDLTHAQAYMRYGPTNCETLALMIGISVTCSCHAINSAKRN